MAPPVDALQRQTKRYEQKRQAILDGAVRLFNEKGLKGTTLADVAQSVGLITNSVTYYYRRKEDLATACLLRSVETLDGIIAAAMKERTTPDRIRAVLQLYFARLSAGESGAEPPLMGFSDIRALTSPHVEVVFDAYTAMFRRMRDIFRGDGPILSRLALNARTHLLLSLMNGARAWIDGYEPEDYRRVGERMADIVLGGVGSRGSAWNPARLPAIAWPSADEVSPEAFLRSATILINEQGYRGASVEKISARLKVTKGSFYHHNDNKDDLVADCFARTFAVVLQVQRAAEGVGATGWDRLCAAAEELVRFQLSEQGPLLRSSAFSALPEGPRGETKRRMDRLARRFGALIVDGMVDGSIRPLDPAIAARLIDSMVNAAAEIERWVPGVTAENAGDLFARPLLMGVTADA
ncbi:MAG TPA: TetR family transcriptional regulator [Microvirga sp.]|jgi:AcrR family transcriptional regulator|nr:TetR family transcriptional regulator [Microvirga sp.]